MKRIILIAALAGCLAACDSREPDPVEDDKQEWMTEYVRMLDGKYYGLRETGMFGTYHEAALFVPFEEPKVLRVRNIIDKYEDVEMHGRAYRQKHFTEEPGEFPDNPDEYDLSYYYSLSYETENGGRKMASMELFRYTMITDRWGVTEESLFDGSDWYYMEIIDRNTFLLHPNGVSSEPTAAPIEYTRR